MRYILALVFTLMPFAAIAQSCLPFPVEQTADHYIVRFGGVADGIDYRLQFNRLTASTGEGRAEQARALLQARSDNRIPIQELKQLGDDWGYNDPADDPGLGGRAFYSDIHGDRNIPEHLKTHVTERCAIAEVDWDPVTQTYSFTWRAP